MFNFENYDYILNSKFKHSNLSVTKGAFIKLMNEICGIENKNYNFNEYKKIIFEKVNKKMN